jgi:hypothetical protein
MYIHQLKSSGWRQAFHKLSITQLKILLSGMAMALYLMACGGGVSGGGTGGGTPVQPNVASSIGPVRGFGSIFVGKIEFDDAIEKVTSQDGLPVDANDLALGVQVSILSTTTTLSTTDINAVAGIEIKRLFMGTLEVVSDTGKSILRLNGQRVLTDRRTVVVDAASAQALAGTRVHVSGYLEPVRNDIIATRIEPVKSSAPARDTVYITGSVRSIDTEKQIASLGFTTVSYADVPSISGELNAGDVVRVEAKFSTAAPLQLIAFRLTKLSAVPGKGDVVLRGVVQSRPSAASPRTALIVDGYSIQISDAVLSELPDLRRGSTVEVIGRLENTTVQNASLRIIGYPIDTLPGEEPVQEPPADPGAPPVDDYEIKGGIVESVDPGSASYVVRGIRIQMPLGSSLPPEIYVGSVVSIAGEVRQDATGFYLEAVVTKPDRQWQGAQAIPAEGVSSSILLDSSGDAITFWHDTNNASAVSSSYYNAALNRWTLQAPVSLGVGTVNLVTTAVNDGRAVSVYTSPSGCVYAKALSTQVANWGSTQQIGNCTDFVSAHTAAIDAAGNAVLVWTRQLSASSYGLYGSKYDAASASWSPSTPIFSTTSASFFFANALATDNQGNAMVAWAVGNTTYASRYSNGAWSSASVVDSANRTPTNLVLDDNGNATLISFGNGLEARRYTISGGWQPAVVLGALTGGGKNTMATDGAGNVVVVWRSSNTIGNLYAKKYSIDNAGWGPTQELFTLSYPVDSPLIAANRNGQAVLVFNTVGNTNPARKSEVYAQRYNFTTDSWGEATLQQIPSELGIGSFDTAQRVAINNTGAAIITWRQRDAALVTRNYINILR